MRGGNTNQDNQEPQVSSLRIPGGSCLRLVFCAMIKNSQRQKQKRQEKREQRLRAARWLAGLVQVVAVDAEGNQRFLEGDEAVDAIIRQWDAEEAG